MTVKELKEKLNEFDDNLGVMIPSDEPSYVPALTVSRGINELDGCIFISDYIEDYWYDNVKENKIPVLDNEIIKAWEKILSTGDAPIGKHWSVGGIVTTQLAKETFDILNRQKAEIDDLFLKLNGVMWSVDKWLDGEELNQHEVNRAITMREKTLQIVEKKATEIDILIRKNETLKDEVEGLQAEIKRLKAEQTYKNGYNDGVRELVEKLEKRAKTNYILPFGESVGIIDIYEAKNELTKQ